MSNESPASLLVLIGFMGAGKSTLGRLLANRLECPLVDLDQEIARIHGQIHELFSKVGESGFRAIEHHQLHQILPTLANPAVLALGGGAFLQRANRELLANHGATIIFIDAPFELLRTRIENSSTQRPLARDPKRLRELYEQRRPIYQLAHHTFQSSESDPSELLTSMVQLAKQLGVRDPARDKL